MDIVNVIFSDFITILRLLILLNAKEKHSPAEILLVLW